ncbi:prolipoprotein diacylglyceryl transferase [Psychroflexus lacisalsi]|uniref:Phosphatidylglycerol--prolipoprotein diacylglyceryl transferase n=1 Tax=Psychroflexus lacisalsi TaxID=503928 RepID=A0ABN1K677_9FLAO|nr:prolipoprotein diacylglyceryl transferase [Psychroflexus lacisalsi]MBZ9619259.1 prolipoprotein diacylglyceryl transferase [Psychroflexus lacisalsi]
MFQAIQWDPSLGIDLGILTLRYYSLMFLIAFGGGFYISKRIFIHEGISLEKLDKLLIYTIISTLAGARLGHVIFYQPELFLEDPLSVFLPVSFVPDIEFTGFRGLASHGAAIGIAIGMYFYSKNVTKKSIFWILDRITIPVALGAVFVRIGNFLNSEIVGKATGSDFGVIFVQLGESFPRHPAQLYESVSYLILFGVLSLLFWKTNLKQKKGVLFGIFFTLLWTIRFLVEYVKEPQVAERADWLFNTGQLLSIPMIIIGLGIIYFSNKTSQKSEVV